jgi:excisionase family DNA binding protein
VTGNLLGVTEVAALLSVDPRTIRRWADSGRLTATRTPGGHRRFLASDVERALVDRLPDAAVHPAARSSQRPPASSDRGTYEWAEQAAPFGYRRVRG